MRPHAVLLESSVSSTSTSAAGTGISSYAPQKYVLFSEKKKKKMLKKPQFCALVSLRNFKLIHCIKPGSKSAKQLWSVLGKSLSRSCVKAGPVQTGRHGARKAMHDLSSRASSWGDVWISYRKIYTGKAGYRNSLGNSALSWLNYVTAQILSKQLLSAFWVEDNLSFLLFFSTTLKQRLHASKGKQLQILTARV